MGLPQAAEALANLPGGTACPICGHGPGRPPCRSWWQHPPTKPSSLRQGARPGSHGKRTETRDRARVRSVPKILLTQSRSTLGQHASEIIHVCVQSRASSWERICPQLNGGKRPGRAEAGGSRRDCAGTERGEDWTPRPTPGTRTCTGKTNAQNISL